MKGKVRFAVAAIFLIFGWALLSDAMSQSKETIEGARKEGELVFYSGIPVNDAKTILTAFEKKYPFVKTTHYRSRGSALISRIQGEQRAGRHAWDVFNATGLEGYVLVEQGFFAAYDSPERKHFPEGHKDAENFWTTMYTNPMLASYNRRLVASSELPKDYSALLDPKWKGKLGLDPQDIEWYANIKAVWGAEKTRKFFAGLVMQEIGLREGRTLLTQFLGAGEFYILVNNYLQNVIEAKERGTPIELLALDPVVLGAAPISINKMAPHPNAARLFVDFCLSREGQEIIVAGGRSSARADIKGNPLDTIKNVKIVPSDLKLGKVYREARDEYRELLGIAKK
jgi:iron(III) transport system substrate-binding protein